MRSWAVLGVVGVLLLTASPVSSDEESPHEVVGEFVRFGLTESLTMDDVEESEGSLIVDEPWMASEIRVDAQFLEDRLGHWSVQSIFAMDADGRAVFEAGELTFSTFVPSAVPVFTFGSEASVLLDERPMWVSVEPIDGGLELTLDDGDSTGQNIQLSKSWLHQHGIHYPLATHEDGSDVPVTLSADGSAFILAMPHFSYVILTPADIDIKGRVNDNFVVHAGQVRWTASEQQLEVDVPAQLSAYETWVERDYVDVNVANPMLVGRAWTIESLQGREYYVIGLESSETPSTLVFRPFSLNSYGFSSGSYDLLRYGKPVLTTTASGTETLHVEFLDDAPPFVTANATLLESLGVTRPQITSSEGAVLHWGVLNLRWLQLAVPPNATYVTITQSPSLEATAIGIVSIEDRETSLGELCEAALGMNAHVESWEEGPSKAALFVRGTEFCWEWDLFEEGADYYSVVVGITNLENEVMCGSGEETSKKVTSKKGFRICKWPDSEEFPTGAIIYRIHAASWQWHEDEDTAVTASGVACYGGLLVAAGAGLVGVFFTPALAVSAGAIAGAAPACAYYATEIWGEVSDEGYWTTTNILLGTGLRSVIGTNEVDLWDPGDPRGDSWSMFDLEHQVLVRPGSWDGKQKLYWTLKDTFDAVLEYDYDVSILDFVQYDANQMTVVASVGHATMEAKKNAFPAGPGQAPNTQLVSIQYPTGADALDWEVPDPHCVLLQAIVSEVGGDTFTLVISSPAPIPACEGLWWPQAPDALPSDPDDPWLAFEVESHDLPEGWLENVDGQVTPADVLVEDGNLTRAIASKLTSNQGFLDGIRRVEVPAPVVATPCEVHEFFYEATYIATVSGESIAGGGLLQDVDSEPVEICFDPLLGIPATVRE